MNGFTVTFMETRRKGDIQSARRQFAYSSLTAAHIYAPSYQSNPASKLPNPAAYMSLYTAPDNTVHSAMVPLRFQSGCPAVQTFFNYFIFFTQKLCQLACLILSHCSITMTNNLIQQKAPSTTQGIRNF